MAGGIDWFRWHHGSVTDPKFQLVARKAGASLPDVLAVWAWLLEKASASDQRGTFGAVDAESLDCLFGFPDDQGTTGSILLAMEARGLIADGRICAWETRQPKREREDSTSGNRVAKFRAKKHHVTPCNASDDQKKPREEESREELTQANACVVAHVPGLDVHAWERWSEYRKGIRKPIKPVSMLAAQKQLAGFGAMQSAVVEQSIANGYQGLFEPKGCASRVPPPENFDRIDYGENRKL